MGTKKQHADVPELQLVTEEDLDDDCFFESLDRVSSRVSIDFDVPSSSSDGDYDDGRCSFASAAAPPSRRISHSDDDEDDDEEEAPAYDYGIWMAEPISITERRRLLLQGMGFSSRKDMAAAEPPLGRSHRRHGSISLKHSLSRLSLRTAPIPIPVPAPVPVPVPVPAPLPAEAGRPRPSPSLTRSRSDTHAILRPPAILRRTLSAPPSLRLESSCRGAEGVDSPPEEDEEGACRIKNLDTGKEFVVSEAAKDGTRDLQSGLKLSMDEFDRVIGYSPVVKELLMRRVSTAGSKKGEDSNTTNSTKNSSNKSSGSRRKGGWLKNIKFVASSMTGLLSEKERRSGGGGGSGGNEWMKVRQHGKSHKELTGLYMCQQIPAHQGSIWCIKFSSDSLYMASAGEDRVVLVWQVIESENFSPDSLLGLDHSRTSSSLPPLPPQAPNGSKVKISSNGSRRVSSVPDYIVMPKTAFSLSEKPLCSLEGHLDDVLDLSWSKSQPQHLLSSSMDKTVRLWDVESKACIKLFAHNDYVTCIQFNPVDDRYFISGSLDEKVRIWNIPDRQVVDWTDLHEMVTAVCYTPDGQGALVGSHKGTCRFYDTSDCKLNQESQIDIRSKKKKSQAKKITGFQYAPGNTSEVLITSADSQIRIFDGTDMINKFRGFRNTSSQISASFTTDGKFVVCASEDSHVYVWKRSNAGSGGKSKGLTTTRSHEHFFCKDVSVAIPWPSAGSTCTPPSYSGSHSPLLGSPDRQQSASAVEDNFPSSRSHHPPFSEKSSPERISPSSPESAIGSPSIMSPSPSQRDDAISSASVSGSSSLSSWRWYSGGSGRSNGLAANAWGLVVVTAGLGGEIKVYQNFGLPLRLSRQANLF